MALRKSVNTGEFFRATFQFKRQLFFEKKFHVGFCYFVSK